MTHKMKHYGYDTGRKTSVPKKGKSRGNYVKNVVDHPKHNAVKPQNNTKGGGGY